MPLKDFLPGILGVAQTAVSGIAQGLGARKQHQRNMELAQFQNDANTRYMREMQEYNSPKSQMMRFQDAGLNPHLIYGQGNPGNMSSPQQYPDIKPTDWQRTAAVMAQTMPQINQMRLLDSQINATNAKTIHSYAMVELNRLQQRVMEKNPLLDSDGFKAIIDGLKSAASIKNSDASIRGEQSRWFTKSIQRNTPNGLGFDIEKGTQGAFKMDAELKLLEQKFDLGTTDQKIKGQILESKEFQNAILEVQKRFLSDGEIGPQQIMTFIQLLLMKLL